MKIAIGPLNNSYGAVGRITKTISHYSKHEVIPFKPPSYNRFLMWFWRETGIKVYDPYGFYLSHHHLQKFDIIHFMNHPVYREVHFRPKNLHAKYVYRIPGFYNAYMDKSHPDYQVSKQLDAWMIESCKQCDTIIVGNSWFKEYLSEKYNLDSTIIPNGVSTKKWIRGSPERFQKLYGIDPGFCLFAGRISPEKRPDFFLEIAERMPHLNFIMIGPSIENNKFSRYIMESLPKNVKWLGRLSGINLVDCFSAAEILINPVPSKFGGNVILESMASKTIPIVSVEDINDPVWFEPFVEGLTYPNNNLEGCIEKINYAKENPKLSLKGFERILSEYDWSLIIKKYDQLYESMI